MRALRPEHLADCAESAKPAGAKMNAIAANARLLRGNSPSVGPPSTSVRWRERVRGHCQKNTSVAALTTMAQSDGVKIPALAIVGNDFASAGAVAHNLETSAAALGGKHSCFPPRSSTCPYPITYFSNKRATQSDTSSLLLMSGWTKPSIMKVGDTWMPFWRAYFACHLIS